ncbi:MAG TPA: hypothetical protein VFN87_16155 [Solirubrobacteraceae bacterium]|nr:hypothetical protein [Solirubrobacteraceae bacterium]
MPKLSLSTRALRQATAVALGASAVLGGVAALPATALAKHNQISMIEDFNDIYDPAGTLAQFRALGANTVRVLVEWNTVAPDPNATKKPSFNATDSGAYPAAGWAPYDQIVRTAQQDGLTVDFTVTGGAPRWAEASAAPRANGVNPQSVSWRPNAFDYGQFVQALGQRYSGHFTPSGQSSPLPRVHFWAIYNEPNFGQDLGPQAVNGSRTPTAPTMYRNLVRAGWNGLHRSGHGRDTILIGELAAEGSWPHKPWRAAPQGLPGNYGQTRPLLFIRDLYCVNAAFQPLRGYAARSIGCPTNVRGTRLFRRQNPALFSASGFADHPYDGAASPTSRAGLKPDYATFPVIGTLAATLDHVNHVYGSRTRFAIYNTEYGEITNPPRKGKGYPSPARAAVFMNQAEYISWKSGRLASYMQYLLEDPPANTGAYTGFASGLEFSNGKPKATYAAYQMPVWMPHTSFSHNANQEIWGSARPAPFMKRDGHGNQFLAIQINGRTIRRQRVNDGYFDTHMKFPRGHYTVRLAYTFPTSDSFLSVSELGKTIYSRSFRINVH